MSKTFNELKQSKSDEILQLISILNLFSFRSYVFGIAFMTGRSHTFRQLYWTEETRATMRNNSVTTVSTDRVHHSKHTCLTLTWSSASVVGFVFCNLVTDIGF